LRAYDGPPCVVILDEADQLDDRSVLYDLYALSGISMLLIANDTDAVLAGADERLTSRLRGREHVRFDRYGVAELTAILAARARWGLEAGAIDRAELETIADAAAGDARVAISILRSAARRATREERGRINPRNRPRGDPDRPHRSAPKEPRQAERPPADAFRNHRRTRRDRPDRPLQRVPRARPRAEDRPHGS
jgi:Cdc6-like AAA superfamily ATPase